MSDIGLIVGILACLVFIYWAGGWSSLLGAFIGMAICVFVLEPLFRRIR